MTKRTGKMIAAYVRVSTVGQNEAGQRREIQQWLDGQGIDPATVRWYADKESGDDLDRPEFKRLRRDIFNGVVGTVVVWKLDRLSRKLRDGLNALCEWCDRGLRVVSVTQQIDFNGTMGQMIASVIFAIAEMEQQTRRERQAAGIAAARERGVYAGRKKGATKANPARVYQLKQLGLTRSEIGGMLGISPRTVSYYLRQAEQESNHRK